MKYQIEKNHNQYWISKVVPNTPEYPEYNDCYNFPTITKIIAKVKTLKEAKKIIKLNKEGK
jgi:hypothetical protein